jgi:protein-disulfide isomerase
MRFDNRYLLGGVAAAVVAVFIIAASRYPQAPPAPATTSQPAPASSAGAELSRPYSPTLGPPTAGVTIVEFLDPECESCAAMHPIMKHVLKEFDGRVRLVVRYMPLHRNSVYASSLLEAAREQDKYWELMDAFFARHSEWASHHAPRPDLLSAYAAQIGLDLQRLNTSAAAAEVARRIAQDASDGRANADDMRERRSAPTPRVRTTAGGDPRGARVVRSFAQESTVGRSSSQRPAGRDRPRPAGDRRPAGRARSCARTCASRRSPGGSRCDRAATAGAAMETIGAARLRPGADRGHAPRSGLAASH